MIRRARAVCIIVTENRRDAPQHRLFQHNHDQSRFPIWWIGPHLAF